MIKAALVLALGVTAALVFLAAGLFIAAADRALAPSPVAR